MQIKMLFPLSFIAVISLTGSLSFPENSIILEESAEVLVEITHSQIIRREIELTTWIPFAWDFQTDPEDDDSHADHPSCFLKAEDSHLNPVVSFPLKSNRESGSDDIVLFDFDLKGNYLIVASENMEVWLLTLANKTTEEIQVETLHSFSVASLGLSIPNYYQVAFSQSGDYFYFATEKYLVQFSLSDPSMRGETVSGYEHYQELFYAYEFSGFLFLALGKEGIHIYDMRDPLNVHIAHKLDSEFFGRDSLDIQHFAINHTLIHDVSPEKSYILFPSGEYDILNFEKPNSHYQSTKFLREKQYNGNYLVVADLENGIHMVDISGLGESDPVLLDIGKTGLSSASAVARNQNVLYVLTESFELGSRVFELIVEESSVSNSNQSSDQNGVSGNSETVIGVQTNRVIYQERIKDIFVDEKYLWLISDYMNDAILNSVNATIVPSVQTLRRAISKEDVQSVQKLFAFGRQFLLSMGNGTVFIDEIITIPSYISCSFPQELFPNSSKEPLQFHYDVDIFTLYCNSKKLRDSDVQFDFICQFHYDLYFLVEESLIDNTFHSKTHAFQSGLFLALVFILFICIFGLGTWIFLMKKIRSIKQKYEKLREQAPDSMEKSKINESMNQEAPSFDKELHQSEEKDTLPDEKEIISKEESKKHGRRKLGKEAEKDAFDIDDQPAEYNKDLYK